MQLTKMDVHEKAVKAHWTPDGGALLCEPQMVPRPGSAVEDDGVVIAPSVDGEGRCMVAVLAAGILPRRTCLPSGAGWACLLCDASRR